MDEPAPRAIPRESVVDGLPPDWLDELRHFLSIPSVSADPAHARDVVKAAEWVAGKVRALGGDADVREDGRLVALNQQTIALIR